ncbi:hypothetical protein CB1_000932080 [Camelus ferus]|nr:hypothetical protein CB1_000932080 [Camelus ferus]
MVGNNPYATAEENSTELSTNAEVPKRPAPASFGPSIPGGHQACGGSTAPGHTAACQRSETERREPSKDWPKPGLICSLRAVIKGVLLRTCVLGDCPWVTSELSFLEYKSKPFCEKLLSWVKSSGCAKVVVLSSSHSYHRNDLQLRRYAECKLNACVSFLHVILLRRVFACAAEYMEDKIICVIRLNTSVQNKMQSLNWEEMEKTACIPEIDESELCVRIPGGGITKTLYDEGCSKDVPVAVLLKFVSEGDNIPDALGLVEYLNEWLQIIKPCAPPSSSRRSSLNLGGLGIQGSTLRDSTSHEPRGSAYPLLKEPAGAPVRSNGQLYVRSSHHGMQLHPVCWSRQLLLNKTKTEDGQVTAKSMLGLCL